MEAIPSFAPITAKVDGHALSLFVSGADRLAALLDIIEGAQTSLRLFFYMFSDDETARWVRDALVAAAARGVKVSLLIDGFGSGHCPDSVYQPLVDAGVHFARFLPRWGRRYMLRNHQKIVIADDARVLIGGANVDARYFADDPGGKSWHDLYLGVEGPAALRLAEYYDGLARWTKREGGGGVRSLIRLLGRKSEKRGPLRWLFNGPFRRLSPLTHSIRQDIDAAQQLDMIHAYFSPNWGMLRKIGRIVRRGGRARLITAARSDNQTTIAATRHCYRRLLRNGTEIAEYLPQMLHMKLIVADDAVYIGSANFDMRSLYINAEIMLRIEDKGFADAARGLVTAHMPHCDPITRAEHRARSSWTARMRWLVSYFIVSTVDFRLTRSFGLNRE
jgi:cardiolipin synthase A/B